MLVSRDAPLRVLELVVIELHVAQLGLVRIVRLAQLGKLAVQLAKYAVVLGERLVVTRLPILGLRTHALHLGLHLGDPLAALRNIRLELRLELLARLHEFLQPSLRLAHGGLHALRLLAPVPRLLWAAKRWLHCVT